MAHYPERYVYCTALSSLCCVECKLPPTVSGLYFLSADPLPFVCCFPDAVFVGWQPIFHLHFFFLGGGGQHVQWLDPAFSEGTAEVPTSAPQDNAGPIIGFSP